MSENIKIEVDLVYFEKLRAENVDLRKVNDRLYKKISELREAISKAESALDIYNEN